MAWSEWNNIATHLEKPYSPGPLHAPPIMSSWVTVPECYTTARSPPPWAACGFVRKEQAVGVETATGSDYILIRAQAQPPAPGFGRNAHLGPDSLAETGRGGDERELPSHTQPFIKPPDQTGTGHEVGAQRRDTELGGQEGSGHSRSEAPKSGPSGRYYMSSASPMAASNQSRISS